MAEKPKVAGINYSSSNPHVPCDDIAAYHMVRLAIVVALTAFILQQEAAPVDLPRSI